jgi:hypothetical protein
MIAVYDKSGALVGKTPVQDRVDQCSLDPASHDIACAGSGVLTMLRDNRSSAPSVLGQAAVARGAHTVGIDSTTGAAWSVWAEAAGDFVQSFKIQP